MEWSGFQFKTTNIIHSQKEAKSSHRERRTTDKLTEKDHRQMKTPGIFVNIFYWEFEMI